MRQIRVAPRLLPRIGMRPAVATARLRRIAPSLGGSPVARPLFGVPSSSRLASTSSKITSQSEIKKRTVDMDQFPPERIRNLSIIAHIDHGKSTLADRLLQMTDTTPPESNPQFLDKLKVERERGITVKAQTVSIILTHTDGKKYLVNLIDTPGHVDFSYEVSRSLGACEGGLLLVDCTQGIQAQTMSVYHHAVDADLKLLPVINKVDLAHAYPEKTSESIASSLGLPVEDHMRISAKSGLGVETVLHQIIDGLPSPKWEGDDRLRALVFDTFYDRFRGVVSLIRIKSGSIRKGDKIRFMQAGARKYEVLEVGIYNPEEVPTAFLKEGQVGYLVSNMKNSDEAYIGDTVCMADQSVEPLPGFKPMKAMVYAGIFPLDASEFTTLEESITRLTLNDRSVSVERETSAALGQGFRLGFLGTLHMDVFRQRLEDEYQSEVMVTAPTVPYKVVYATGKETFISNPAEFPDVTDTKTRVAYVEEPMVNATIFVPNEYIGEMMDLCARYRGEQQEYKVLEGTDRAILKYKLPLSEIVTDFFSDLKSASSGFASFDYEEAGYEQSKLVKLNMMLNGKPVDALAMIVHRAAAASIGKAWVKKLKEVLPRQLFELAIQAAVGTKIIARETLSAMRKDVTAGLYGGHYERKMKHLNKQKEGKKRLKSLAGNIQVPQSAFYQVLQSRPRAYSTSAGGGAPQDWLSEHLPPVPPREIAEESTEDPIRLSRHDIAPHQRSEILANIHRQVSRPDAADSDQLWAEFSRLYLSSPTPLFSAAELRAIAKTMHTLSRRNRVRLRQANERFGITVEALKDVIGDNAEALRGLELATLVSGSRSARHFSKHDLRKSESRFNSLFPSAPLDPAKREQYTRGLNHILYLCAISREPTRLHHWWNKMVGEGLEITSWAYLARIMVHGLMKQIEPMTLELERCLPHVAQSDPDGAVVLVNNAMWLSITANEWDLALGLYEVLKTQEGDVPSLKSTVAIPETLLPTLGRLRPSRNTFGLFVLGASYRGDLIKALSIMQDMLRDGHVPGVHEYVALFLGFARFGIIPSGPAGSATAAFPLWRDIPAEQVGGISNPWGIEPGTFTSNYGPGASATWTQSALEDLFQAFLNLTPPKRPGHPARAPSAKAVYHTLLAFARVTNADARVVAAVFEAIEHKFGPTNTEGWVGWREDSRLQRVRDRIGVTPLH